MGLFPQGSAPSLWRYYHILRSILHLKNRNVQSVNDIFCGNPAIFYGCFPVLYILTA